MTRIDFATATIARLAPAVARREVSARDLAAACLAQIDRFDPELRAWAAIDRQAALDEAEALDRGPIRGPLHGVPLGVKDIVDVAGLPTRLGSELTPSAPAARDAPLVARLRAAGAVVLGKTATTTFAFLDPAPTRNPWNPQHTPGGSSSGSAAATAAGMCLAAIGTQTGGSLIRPAAYCGLAALKPTYGLVDAEGVFPLAPSLDHPGPMARSAVDVRILMSALAPEAFAGGAPCGQPPRLGWLAEDWFGPGRMSIPHDAMLGVVRDAYAELAGATGATIAPPPEMAQALDMHLRLMACEAARAHAERGFESRGAYPPKIAELLERGRRVTPEEEAEARAFRVRFQQALADRMQGYDALVLPSAPAPAPAGLASTGDGSYNSPWSFAGVPEATIPVGLVDGLPVGLQFIGRAGDDAPLLDVAGWCQERLGFSAVAGPLQSAG